MSVLTPTSIAVIGASTTEGKVGHAVMQNLITAGFAGQLYPVNPKGGEIQGKKAFPSVLEIPGSVDLAVIVIPAKAVPKAMSDCAAKGITNIVVISAGFAELGKNEGQNLQKEIQEIATKHSLNLIGPNCLGILRPSLKLNASFATMPAAGNVALISQSGALAVALMDASPARGLGYSLVLSIGNKAVMDECDFLKMCQDDDETKVIGIYVESIRDGRRFVSIASQISKPIVLLKAGTSATGQRAASSHTGALAGADAAIDAACSEAGIHRARSTADFLDLLQVLSTQPSLLTRRIAIVTNAGGPGILAADAVAAVGLELPALSKENKQKLAAALPAAASVNNPIDVLGDAGVDAYVAALEACGRDKNIDGVAVLLTPQTMTPVEAIARAMITWRREYPMMPIVASFVGGENVSKGVQILQESGVPVFETPERAVLALANLLPRSEKQLIKSSKTIKMTGKKDITTLLKDQKGLLSEEITQKLFTLYDLELPPQKLAQSADEAARIADEIGYPVIAKISSPEILHKTDVSGIRANLKTATDVRSAFTAIQTDVQKHEPHAHIRGILIQKFLPIGNEFIVGAVRDPSFGPMVLVGLGGIYTELFQDTSTRLAPVTLEQSYELLQELQAWKLLLGMRGQTQSDIDELAALVQKISILIAENERIQQLDLNPVLVGKENVIIADAKIITSL